MHQKIKTHRSRLLAIAVTSFLFHSCVVVVPDTNQTNKQKAETPAQTQQTPQEPAAHVVSQGRYTGTVGSSKVDVLLNFFTNGKVEGYYKSKNTGKLYLLVGHNHFEGKLVFTEGSRDSRGNWRSTSVSDLRKSVSRGKIYWKGTMRNFDGRNVAVSWVKQS